MLALNITNGDFYPDYAEQPVQTAYAPLRLCGITVTATDFEFSRYSVNTASETSCVSVDAPKYSPAPVIGSIAQNKCQTMVITYTVKENENYTLTTDKEKLDSFWVTVAFASNCPDDAAWRHFSRVSRVYFNGREVCIIEQKFNL